jgi:hypothetical protein
MSSEQNENKCQPESPSRRATTTNTSVVNYKLRETNFRLRKQKLLLAETTNTTNKQGQQANTVELPNRNNKRKMCTTPDTNTHKSRITYRQQGLSGKKRSTTTTPAHRHDKFDVFEFKDECWDDSLLRLRNQQQQQSNITANSAIRASRSVDDPSFHHTTFFNLTKTQQATPTSVRPNRNDSQDFKYLPIKKKKL